MIIFYIERRFLYTIMEGLAIIEKSYSNLIKFRDIITSEAFSKANTLVITMTNYDMQTRTGLKTAIDNVLTVYKDELKLDKPIAKILTGDIITLKLPKDIDGFVDDLIDSLKTYINSRQASLFNIITNCNSSGGLFNV